MRKSINLIRCFEFMMHNFFLLLCFDLFPLCLYFSCLLLLCGNGSVVCKLDFHWQSSNLKFVCFFPPFLCDSPARDVYFPVNQKLGFPSIFNSTSDWFFLYLCFFFSHNLHICDGLKPMTMLNLFLCFVFGMMF